MIKSNFLSFLALASLLIALSCGKEEIPVDGDPDGVLQVPQLQEATDITSSSFKINWNSISGAERYEIDVATDADFNQILAPYDAFRENGSSFKVTSLDPTTLYYARVRSVRGSEITASSNVISLMTTEPVEPEPDTYLKEAVSSFSVGMAVQSTKLSGSYGEIYKNEFNTLTAEWEMKMNVMYPSEGNYNFDKADKIVDFAVANGMDVHGHALIWHSSTPSWVENFSGTDQEFEEMIKDYITTTVTRYKGKVRAWDVVNEAFEDNGGVLRNSVFRQRMGDDYIAKCYQWTRDADPDVLIFYNDYNMVIDPTKFNAAVAMIDQFISNGVPVDGFGFQMHIAYNGPSKNQIANTAKKITDRNLLLHFSELDVRANPNNDLTVLTEARAIEQQTKVREVVEVYNAIPAASKYALTVWGLKDDESWLHNFWGHVDWPLLYDNQFNIKKAHTGFLEGLE